VTVNGGDFTDCGSTTSEPAVYLGASNETFENSTVGYGAGFGVFVKASGAGTSGETISGNTIDHNVTFGTNTGIGESGSPNTVTGNAVYANGFGGVRANWGATVENNTIYQNGGPGIQLYWATAYSCGCENVIQNNTLYDDAGSEIDSTQATVPTVILQNNVFSVGSGDHVWNGGLPRVLHGEQRPAHLLLRSEQRLLRRVGRVRQLRLRYRRSVREPGLRAVAAECQHRSGRSRPEPSDIRHDLGRGGNRAADVRDRQRQQ
ncbi:MAG TPA: right-handed parallel beta-helix repeat-containing protein, partial [Chloroflexota bacterium]|nr:right-handed parallel beta-helix repeat-containing protein [Chloroflexota bacterium]